MTRQLFKTIYGNSFTTIKQGQFYLTKDTDFYKDRIDVIYIAAIYDMTIECEFFHNLSKDEFRELACRGMKAEWLTKETKYCIASHKWPDYFEYFNWKTFTRYVIVTFPRGMEDPEVTEIKATGQKYTIDKNSSSLILNLK